MTFVLKYLRSRIRILKRFFSEEESISYWENRANKYGVLAVLDKRHGVSEIGKVTEFQVNQIFPYLVRELSGDDLNILDFGCGTGRFMPYFKNLTAGQIIGVDPIKSLIDLAPAIDGVEYRIVNASRSKIPVQSDFADILWICLVLGGIRDSQIDGVINELHRVGKSNALICLVENTSDKMNAAYWTFRDRQFYCNIFKKSKLKAVGEYFDFDERITVFMGRLLK